MSAFVVGDRTINRVVSYMLHDQNLGTQFRHETARVTGVDALINGTREGATLLGQAMFALNVEAVNQRYGPGEATSFRPLDYQYRYEPTDCYQALKSLRCWLYQCGEGNVPERPLFKLMNELSGDLALSIVRSLPEYDEAEWG